MCVRVSAYELRPDSERTDMRSTDGWDQDTMSTSKFFCYNLETNMRKKMCLSVVAHLASMIEYRLADEIGITPNLFLKTLRQMLLELFKHDPTFHSFETAVGLQE